MAAFSKAGSLIRTRFLIISDTHGKQFEAPLPSYNADVAIHCGDLTEHSKIDEFLAAVQLLQDIQAPLKIVIAGNHDFTLDLPVFKQKLADADRIAGEPLSRSLVEREFGNDNDARRILQEAKDKGIIFLEEGTHTFTLANGAHLKVYASPYTPSAGGDWGFQYSGSHDFEIEADTDVVITHGPPRGIMDITAEKKRIGCPCLFAAVARAQPKMHCFGHVHNGWGAKLVAWRQDISERPSHLSDIDNGRSWLIENLVKLSEAAFDSPEDEANIRAKINHYRLRRCCDTSHCSDDVKPLEKGKTLFVNAAVQGDRDLSQLPWLIDIELSRAFT